MAAGRVAVVTGGNKGIGFQVCRLLAKGGARVVLASRDRGRGQAAAEAICAELGSPDRVEVLQLDIADGRSVREFASRLEALHPEGIDALVNNAGMAFKGSTFGASEARTTLGTNVLGTMAVSEAVAPMVKKGGAVVNVCSRSGLLGIIGDASLRSRIEAAASEAEVRGLAEEFISAVEDGTFAQRGWPKQMYGVSKCLEVAFTRVLAAQLESRGVRVNACCPGWCATDMSSWSGPRSAEEGADTPVWLALQPPGTGGFYGERRELDWVAGRR